MQTELFVNFERTIFTELAEKDALLPVPDPNYCKTILTMLQQDAKNIERRLTDINSDKKIARWNINSTYQRKIKVLLNVLDKVMVKEFDIHFYTEVTNANSWHALME